MRHTLEVIFHRPLQLLALIILLPVVGLGIGYKLPRSYQSSATLWALYRYVVIGATGPESDLQSTPATTQANALSELLLSRSFALAVANATDLPSTLPASTRASQQLRDDALFADISAHVQVASQGYNIFGITYTNASPKVAQEVVQATIQNFGEQSQGFSVVEAQHLLDGYQSELANAKQNVADAITAQSKYAREHPTLSQTDLLADPQYALLQIQTQQAQSTLTTIQSNIATVRQEIATQGTGNGSLFKVLDSPKFPDQPVSRLKTLLYSGGIGLGVALLAYVLYVVISVRRDRTVYTPLDLQKITSLPVLMQMPSLNVTTVSLLIERGQFDMEDSVSSV